MTNKKSCDIIFKSSERSTQPIFSRGIFPSRDEYDNIVGNADSYKALWPSGKAKVCNTSIPGSIPGGASKKSRTPIGVLLFLMCYARSEPCPVRKAHGIRFATFAPRAARNSGYISPDLDGREKYLREFLYFSFWERTESGSHSPKPKFRKCGARILKST